MEGCVGLHKLDKACFEMAVKGEQGCSLVNDENIRNWLVGAVGASLGRGGWELGGDIGWTAVQTEAYAVTFARVG